MLSACVSLSAGTQKVFQNLRSDTLLSYTRRCQPALTLTLKFTDEGSMAPRSERAQPSSPTTQADSALEGWACHRRLGARDPASPFQAQLGLRESVQPPHTLSTAGA